MTWEIFLWIVCVGVASTCININRYIAYRMKEDNKND